MQTESRIIVELEPGVWLADGKGDPTRTIVKENARQFTADEPPNDAIREARKYRQFPNARVLRWRPPQGV